VNYTIPKDGTLHFGLAGNHTIIEEVEKEFSNWGKLTSLFINFTCYFLHKNHGIDSYDRYA
jgi:hypothetical protein